MKIHIVKSGDTLYALSQKYGVPLQKIIEANPQITNPDVLAIGDKVKIPSAAVPVPENNEVYYKHTVKQGDTLWKLSKAWGITLKDMIDANPQLKNPNALLVGEIVNIPKKGTPSAIQPQSSSNATIVDKTKLGAKDYTGVKEQPPAATPAPNKEPEAAPIINKAPEVSPTVNKAPQVSPAVNKAPEVSPTVNKAPQVSPAVNKAPEVSPVHEMIHEKQSLFVQISVPAQEAISYETPEEKSNSEVQPTSWHENKAASCDNTFGYPGLNTNPYFMDCPPAYPLYEPMAVMGMNSAPSYAQPASYIPEYASPYGVYPAANYPGAWYPNAAPEYTNVSPVNENSSYAPQYGGQSMNLPWPSCGCGAGVPLQSVQPYAYEQPMFNNYPGYMQQPVPGMVSPYGVDMPSQANAVSPSTFAAPITSNIPAYPIYPAVENHAHNRVPEIQEPEFIEQEPTQAVEAGRSETAVKSKGGKAKASAAKVKTSGQNTNNTSKSSAKQRTNHSARKSTAKKSKNPWISN
ncbi:LysM peptidoglycan-binding domain-containing protein [Paenibacillus sp. S150]|uniref:LysM peptidoglycan-binding domain-containing protein n=1 Tax=Paenibacillus sp. S150 TaxID=2749826 RepID=UPI001C56DDD6|nr:LysM peptidoglycan-binding domain-containing protein [Paenibacillus sp. S150]MBW4084698.1 LysM peptidoglycan-binding domain-containing protein [Paenibacillus sp. S150]